MPIFTLNCAGKLLLAEKQIVMGILNLTSDSFYAGSRLQKQEDIVNKAAEMYQQGADIVDLGAQSTRPGSERLQARDELEKLLPAIEMIREKVPDVLLSIDTYHAEVAKKCVEAGAHIINDISGGNMDPSMIAAVSALNVPYICMHMKGVPETMHLDTSYEDLIGQILDYFIWKTEECTRAGIHDVIIDPGFGFGKNIRQNLLLLKRLSLLKILDKPILCGLSRKSTIYKTLQTGPEDSLTGTTVLNTIALQNGASILRVHDVKEAVQAVKLYQAYQNA